MERRGYGRSAGRRRWTPFGKKRRPEYLGIRISRGADRGGARVASRVGGSPLMPEADAIADISPPMRVVCPGVSRSAGRGRSARQSWRSRRETRHRNLKIISRESWGETPAGRPRPGTGTRRRGGIIDTERGVHDPNADVPAAERTKRDGRYSRRRGLCDRSSARSWPLPSPNVQLIFITFCPLRTWAHSRLTESHRQKLCCSVSPPLHELAAKRVCRSCVPSL